MEIDEAVRLATAIRLQEIASPYQPNWRMSDAVYALIALLEAYEQDQDRPGMDGTDAAHPAWWRGNDAGMEGAVIRIRAALDGLDSGAGVLGDASLESVRRDILALREAHEQALAEVARLREALETSPDDVGRIMHETWSRTKRAQGFHNEQETCGWCKPVHPIGDVADSYPCRNLHRDLIPWDALPQGQKDFNRHAFDDVFAEMRRRAAPAPQAEGRQEVTP